MSALTPQKKNDADVTNTGVICVPGQRLCLADEKENVVSGVGTYERQGYIYASLLGSVHVRQKSNVRQLLNILYNPATPKPPASKRLRERTGHYRNSVALVTK